MSQEAPAAASSAPARAVRAGAPARRPATPAVDTSTAVDAETCGHSVCGDQVEQPRQPKMLARAVRHARSASGIASALTTSTLGAMQARQRRSGAARRRACWQAFMHVPQCRAEDMVSSSGRAQAAPRSLRNALPSCRFTIMPQHCLHAASGAMTCSEAHTWRWPSTDEMCERQTAAWYGVHCRLSLPGCNMNCICQHVRCCADMAAHPHATLHTASTCLSLEKSVSPHQTLHTTSRHTPHAMPGVLAGVLRPCSLHALQRPNGRPLHQCSDVLQCCACVALSLEPKRVRG